MGIVNRTEDDVIVDSTLLYPVNSLQLLLMFSVKVRLKVSHQQQDLLKEQRIIIMQH